METTQTVSPKEFRERLDSLYKLMRHLKDATELNQADNLDTLLPLIPKERHEDIDAWLEAEANFVATMRTQWAAYRAQEEQTAE